MSKAEERALEAYPPTFTSGKRYAKRVQSEKVDTHAPIRSIFIKGYEQAEKDTIAEVEKWLRANFHHCNCWNEYEFCVSLRTYFGIKK